MATTTDWTEKGHRVRVDISPNGMIVLTCESQAVTAPKDTPQRLTWVMSQLGIFVLTPRSEAQRLVAHWLRYYYDDALLEAGVHAFVKEWLGVAEAKQPESGGEPPTTPQGVLH